MHLNVSGPCGHFGNRPDPAPDQPLHRAAERAFGRDRTPAPLPLPRPSATATRANSQGTAVGNYMPVTCKKPRYYWEAAPLRLPRRPPIWRIPEPPILFLLVGKRGNAGNGSESALQNADVAQLVEHHLAKVDVASSNLVVRSLTSHKPIRRSSGSGRLAQR